MDILLCKSCVITHLYMFSNYIMLFMSLEVIQQKYCPTHIFPFLALTLYLTNAIKRPDNFKFSEKFFRSHDGRGKILKVMKARACKWDNLFRNDG